MSKYELMFILDPAKVEGNGEAFDATIQAYLKELGAEVTRVKFFEKRTFARPIGRHKAGLYWDYVAELPATAPAAVQDKYRLNETVLRIGIFHFEDGQDDEVFTPRDANILGEESFQDEFENENYRFRGPRKER
ncbi:MAG: 30S ribosomal protein S6 [Lentisphaeria bacterium]|nr:30S ribosomal protein S6 [Lentisphaeria bacterium]